MKTIEIDLETRSDCDITKCGVYAYVDSPYFAITLMSVSVDDGEVQLYDLACGDTVPENILRALVDESVTKRAFNVNFERVCLSKYLREQYPQIFRSYSINEDTVGDYLSPVGWQCTMIHCRTLGLPSTLADAGAALKLEQQKMPEGKALIKYFCIPYDTVDGIPQFHTPADAPEKWETFKAYNRQDVEAELAIDRRLSRFPVPDSIWEEFYLDQEINDRGIRVDMELVEAALTLDAQAKEKLSADMRRLTGIENPNSVYQLLDWLDGQGYKSDSLDKKQVRELLKTAKDPVRSVLELRLMLSKSSVKKYQAMQTAACSDSRARGMFSFYGAARTGRWCLTGDHEVLTENGWCRLDEWHGGKIACWTPSGEQISFQNANALSFPYAGEMYEYNDKRIAQISTPDHRMYVKPRYDKTWTVDTVSNMAKYRPAIPFTGYRQVINGMEHSKLRVMVMVQADGHYTSDGSIRFAFVKLRKVERCKMLLRAADIPFTYKTYLNESKVRHQFVINARDVPMWLRLFRNKTFGTWLFDESPDVFFDELVYWDGYRSAKNSIQYVTCNKQNADIVQAFAHISGRAAQMKVKSRKDAHPNWSDAYYLDIWLTPKNCHEIRNKPTISHFTGKVYCAETKTGFFLVRRNGRVWVTGNSGRHIQLQNLPQNHIPDLTEARDTVKHGYYDEVEMLYEDVPDTLSQLIRTAFVPRPGYKFIVADFSAIEARVIAWLAGEQWRMDAFANGEDIYCASASKMFGVPVVKHGVNGHLRQKGKVAELACIAEGQLVLTNHGLIPIERVTTNDLLWDGESWVQHEGVIYKGEREVITYEGLTATPDHLVWIEGQSQPIQFGIAAACGAHLVQTGNGRKAIRLGEDHQSRKTVECSNESLLRAYGMSGVQICSVDTALQSDIGKIEGLSAVFAATTDSDMARKKAYCCKTALRKPQRSRLSKLRCKRNSVQICKYHGRRGVSYQNLWSAGTVNGNRPDRQQRGLRTRKSALCISCRKQSKQTYNSFIKIRAEILALCTYNNSAQALLWNDTGGDHTGCGECCCKKAKVLDAHICKARLYDIRNAGRHHRFTVSGKLVHNCGYGGSVGAMKAMGGDDLNLTDAELKQIVNDWRDASPHIVDLWWAVDEAVKKAIKQKTTTETHGLQFSYQSKMLFITLPSGRKLCYAQPRIGENQFGGESVTYMGTAASKKWERIESYGPKFVENIVQAVARDLLMYAMQTLRCCFIVATVHDEMIIEADRRMSLPVVCEQMARTPAWAKGLILRADGYECEFYRKD